MQTSNATKPGVWSAVAGAIMLAGGIALPTALQSCQATQNSDGTITFEFSPEHTITAHGLENALSQMVELIGDCVTAERPCTPDEIQDISQAIKKILDAKQNAKKRSGGAAPDAPQPKGPPPPQPG